LRPRSAVRALLATAVAVAALAAAGCRQDMHDQPKIRPLGPSVFFADGQGARPLPAHTVARGLLKDDVWFWTGKAADGKPAAALPPGVPLDRATLERGHERFDIFCSPCHDRTGNGRGMVVRRGFKQPPSYHIDRLRQSPVGYFFDVMTNGFGNMPSYAAQIPPRDRWAIAAYVKALQRSQHVPAAELTAVERAQLETAPAHEAPAGH